MVKKSTTTPKKTSSKKSATSQKSTAPKKSTRTKGGARTKKSAPQKTKKSVLSVQLLKIFSGLVILIMVVLGVGILADIYLKDHGKTSTAAIRPKSPLQKPQPHRSKPKSRPTSQIDKPDSQQSKKTKAVAITKQTPPAFEIFTPEKPLAAKPLQPLNTIPGDTPPLVAIIIDDVGYDQKIANRFLSLNVPLTFSMLPYGTYSRKINDKAHAKGLETMLHLPMEPNEYPKIKPGPGGLLTDMTPDELISQLNRNIDQFVGLKGVNNHMGSRISASPEQMRQIFSILKKNGLYYVDSRTTASSVAQLSADKFRLPYAERDIFIDHYVDEKFIRIQLKSLIQRAKQQGYAIGIAHPHEVTYNTLKAFLPRLKKEIAIVPASTIVQQVTLAKTGPSHAKR